MTNNTKQGLIVIGLTLGLLIVTGYLLYRKQWNQEQKALDRAVQRSMEQSYQDLVAYEASVHNSKTGSITTADLWVAFCDTNYGTLKFMNFYRADSTLLAKEPGMIGSSKFLCVVGSLSSAHGIDAAGVFRGLTNGEFESWPHISAKDLMTNR